MIKINLSYFALFFLILGCKEQDKNQSPGVEKDQKMIPVEANNGNGAGAPSLEEAFVQNIERAHHKKEFMEHPAVAFDLDLDFNGKEGFNARITMMTNSSKIHMDKTDGTSLIFADDKAYLSPETAVSDNARFDLFTWPYFFALPFKLDDQGANLERLGERDFDGELRETYKLTFAPGTGNSPDDWYLIYLNEDETVHAAAYIVTYGGKKQAEAEKNPHCIVYDNYQEVQTVPVATSWKFYNWSEADGLQGDPIGEAVLSNINFKDPGPNLFTQPTSFKIIEKSGN
ncbi:hypothetical protein [Flavimarina sp. Hel_I_48]|uniref:hypothetical protein n=1 Tax=Flavimarina sp. Hel_I_48 TaxID=1392488 RepID=UPI0013DCE4F7|nr:hypothetical protein [Flavimarina sp. Hel_I_48]